MKTLDPPLPHETHFGPAYALPEELRRLVLEGVLVDITTTDSPAPEFVVSPHRVHLFVDAMNVADRKTDGSGERRFWFAHEDFLIDPHLETDDLAVVLAEIDRIRGAEARIARTDSALIKTLAVAFIEELESVMDADDLEKLRKETALAAVAAGAVLSPNDFIDANVAMDYAVLRVLGISASDTSNGDSVMSDAMMHLWNTAWDAAKTENYVKEEIKL